MLSQYKKATKLYRYNDVEKESKERSLSEHPELTTRVAYNQIVLLFNKESLVEYNPSTIGNILLLEFSGGGTNKLRTGNMQVHWNPERSLAVLTDVGVPVD